MILNSSVVLRICLVTQLLLTASALHAQSSQAEAATASRNIRQIAFSPDGRLLAVAIGEPNKPGQVVVWEWQAKKTVFVHQEPVGICTVSFAPNGNFLAIGIFGPTAKLISPETGAVIREIRGHEGHVRSVAFVSNDILATGSYDKSVRLWDMATGNEIAKLGEHNNELRDISASPDGKWLISAAWSPDVRLWSIVDRKQAAEFQPSSLICPTVGFSRDGKFILTGRWDGILRIQESGTHEIRAAIRDVFTCRGFDMTPDNRMLIVCGDRPSVSAYRLSLFKPSRELEKRIENLIGIWQDDDYQKRERATAEIVTLGLVAEPQLREAMKSQLVETRIRARTARETILSPKSEEIDVSHEANVGTVRFSPDGKLVASGDADGVVKLWDPTNGRVESEFRAP